MSVAKWILSLFTSQDPATYKAAIDGNFAVAQRIVDNFAPRAQDTPNMTVHLDAGSVFSGTNLTEVAAQNTGTITAPVSNSRIDRIVVSAATGTISVITGTPGASPSPPAITAGNLPVAQVLLTSSTTAITNSMITDERNLNQIGIGGNYQPLNSNLTDISALSASVNTFLAFNATNVIKQTAAQAKTSLAISASDVSGLGSGATLNAGTSANNLVQLTVGGIYPAIDGSLITNITNSAFSGSLSGNGYINVPGGLIIQWGGVTTTSSSHNVSYPISFPNNVYSVVACAADSDVSTSAETCGVNDADTSGFEIHGYRNNTGASIGLAYWVAFGR